MYKLTYDKELNKVANVVIRIEDQAFIPFDPANADYQEYLKWLEAGNTPLPAEE
jgi:hypothetical protein